MFPFNQRQSIRANLQEEFIETLKKNVKAETFKQTELQLREKLKKEFSD